ncbi:unnamed protein product [Polarella glacialis]|uniref:Uncharacterized protein n=1 Tax=Polarella glacialis TaxID=89957 RepID=A0A813H4A1_POLGL|nr:unnamed protein product [Polarella glacialis]CAE8632704.1 unnamed protein product [Polarella glacialis]CAE8695220.1 unnamed protein product [Polarella glacialis]CAE8732697.1 unnamed protein product [Polarella glacialis]
MTWLSPEALMPEIFILLSPPPIKSHTSAQQQPSPSVLTTAPERLTEHAARVLLLLEQGNVAGLYVHGQQASTTCTTTTTSTTSQTTPHRGRGMAVGALNAGESPRVEPG